MNKKIGIWGLGIVGKSAIEYFYHKNCTLEVLDQRIPSAQEYEFLKAYNATFIGQEHLLSFLENNENILPSPGIDLRPYNHFKHKWLAELDLFGKECITPIIAITGSVGKTTITHLLSQLLQANGKKVFTGGNIGKGLLDSIACANQADYVILEVSSFQLEHCTSFAPYFAICTNIHANHLDRHGTLDNYKNAKLRMFAHQKIGDQALVPLELYNDISQKIKDRHPFHFFSNSVSSNANFSLYDFHNFYFLHNQNLMMNYQTSSLPIVDFSDAFSITYQENLIILAAALHILGILQERFTEILRNQILPQHRLEKIATIDGIDFYNDSKATIPQATLAAVKKIKDRPIILLLGGVSKGVDRSDLIYQLINHVRFIVCFGKEAPQLKHCCDTYKIPALSVETLDQAFKELPYIMKSPDQILFSPAGASFDLFTDYQARGHYFKTLVSQLKSNS